MLKKCRERLRAAPKLLPEVLWQFQDCYMASKHECERLWDRRRLKLPFNLKLKVPNSRCFSPPLVFPTGNSLSVWHEELSVGAFRRPMRFYSVHHHCIFWSIVVVISLHLIIKCSYFGLPLGILFFLKHFQITNYFPLLCCWCIYPPLHGKGGSGEGQ